MHVIGYVIVIYNMDTRTLANLLHEGAKRSKPINELSALIHVQCPCYNWLVAILTISSKVVSLAANYIEQNTLMLPRILIS